MQSGSTPQVADKYSNITMPKAQDLTYQIQQLVEQGVMTPEDAKAALAGRSEMDNVTTDPKLQAAQMGALDSLQDIANNGGMTTADKANLNQISLDEATKAKGQRDAIIQNAQSRGLGGSGLDLMAQLQNEQNSATNKSTRDLNVAGMAQQRALDALMQEGNLAGSVQNQQFNQGAQKANANDAIAKFNAQNQQGVNMQNAQAHNVAQATNLANKQNISNTNAGLQTQQNKRLISISRCSITRLQKLEDLRLLQLKMQWPKDKIVRTLRMRPIRQLELELPPARICCRMNGKRKTSNISIHLNFWIKSRL